jgi:hypothetical protein
VWDGHGEEGKSDGVGTNQAPAYDLFATIGPA